MKKMSPFSRHAAQKRISPLVNKDKGDKLYQGFNLLVDKVKELKTKESDFFDDTQEDITLIKDLLLFTMTNEEGEIQTDFASSFEMSTNTSLVFYHPDEGEDFYMGLFKYKTIQIPFG